MLTIRLPIITNSGGGRKCTKYMDPCHPCCRRRWHSWFLIWPSTGWPRNTFLLEGSWRSWLQRALGGFTTCFMRVMRASPCLCHCLQLSPHASISALPGEPLACLEFPKAPKLQAQRNSDRQAADQAINGDQARSATLLPCFPHCCCWP